MEMSKIYSSIFGNLLDIFGARKCEKGILVYTNGSFLLAENVFI